LLIVALLFVVIGCSSGTESDMSSPDYIEQIVNPDRSLFYGETITIATDYTYRLLPHATVYMMENPGVRIQIIDYSLILRENDLFNLHTVDWDYGPVRMEVATQLMAGSAPTLIASRLVDPFDPRQAVFFYDLYKLMDADPNFNEEDRFMNAFHAFAVDGRLHHFPFHIIYTPVTANTTIPGLLEAFAEYADGITMSELIALHRTFSEQHPHLLEEYFSTELLLHYYLDRFVDIETGRVDFGREFIDLINYAESITSPDFTRRWRNVNRLVNIERRTERNLFHFEFDWFYFRTFLGGFPICRCDTTGKRQ